MRLLLIAIFTFFGFAGAVQACPDSSLWGNKTYSYTGQEVLVQTAFDVVAGGQNSVQNCGHPFTGYFTTAPNFSFEMSEMAGHGITVFVDSNCDAALMVNAPNGQWFYGDNGTGTAVPNPVLQFGRLADGVLDIWVGSPSGAGCNATFNIQTYQH